MTRKTLLFAVLIAAALLVSACGDDDTTSTTAAPATTSAPQTDPGDGGFPDQFAEGYMEGCTSEAPEEACQCTLDEFEKRYSLEEFIGFADDAEDPRVLEVITICLTNG